MTRKYEDNDENNGHGLSADQHDSIEKGGPRPADPTKAATFRRGPLYRDLGNIQQELSCSIPIFG